MNIDRPTPETDKAERMAFAGEYMVPTEFARELERQRDEAYQKQNETYRSSKYACDYHHELKINAEKERDEARESAKELSDIASKHLSFLLAITPTSPNEKHEKETEKVIDTLKRWKKL